MKFLFVCFLGFLAVIAIGAAGGSSTPAASVNGDPAIYASIGANTDCSSLQSQFEWASSTHEHWKEASNVPKMKVATSYMRAVDERMRAIGCY